MITLYGSMIAVQALTVSYETAKIEEDPGKVLNETLEDALYSSLQSESASWKGMFPGREYYANSIMHNQKGISLLRCCCMEVAGLRGSATETVEH